MAIPENVSMYKLDVGCGTGKWVYNHSNESEDFIIGVDMQDYPEWFKSKPANVQFIIADARQLPFKDKAFGYVHSHCMSGLDAKDVSEAASEMQRVLMEGDVYFSVSASSPEEERVKLWEKRDAKLNEFRKSWLRK
jgi:ubiquinone/menaquinone biosynthesis C-methylase UbiE